MKTVYKGGIIVVLAWTSVRHKKNIEIKLYGLRKTISKHLLNVDLIDNHCKKGTKCMFKTAHNTGGPNSRFEERV